MEKMCGKGKNPPGAGVTDVSLQRRGNFTIIEATQ